MLRVCIRPEKIKWGRISSYSFLIIFTRIRFDRIELVYDLVYDTTLYDLVVFRTPDYANILKAELLKRGPLVGFQFEIKTGWYSILGCLLGGGEIE